MPVDAVQVFPFLAGQFTDTYGTWSVEWSVQVADLNGDGFDDVLLSDPQTGQWFTGRTIGMGTSRTDRASGGPARR